MTPVPRYAILLTHEDGSLFVPGEKRKIGRVIRSIDSGDTWTMVDVRSIDAARQIARALTRDVSESAVEELRSALEEEL